MIMQYFELLENRFQRWIGEEWKTIAVSSGTAALHVGLEALQLPLGSKVLVPDYCMYAIPRAVVLAGHVPVFGDCFSETLNLDIARAVRTLGQVNCEEIKAVVVVHNYGRKAEMGPLSMVAKEFGWKIVEDLAEAHGVAPDMETDIACWSFYKNKIIAGEEGGMIATKSLDNEVNARSLRCLGFTETHDFWHRPRGVNARLSNACAKLILPSLFEVKDNLKKRVAVEAMYERRMPDKFKMPPRHVPWVYDVRIPGCDFKMMTAIVKLLNSFGIQARQGFKSNTYQAEFKPSVANHYPESYLASNEVMYFPIEPKMLTDRMDYSVAEFIKALNAVGY